MSVTCSGCSYDITLETPVHYLYWCWKCSNNLFYQCFIDVVYNYNSVNDFHELTKIYVLYHKFKFYVI